MGKSIFKKLFKSRYEKAVFVTGDVLFLVLKDDLKQGLCTDILFSVDGDMGKTKHRFGAYGDNGETRHNVRFYLDKQEFDSLDAMKEKGILHMPLPTTIMDTDRMFVVYECNGCYPESTPILVENDWRARLKEKEPKPEPKTTEQALEATKEDAES